jgi:hypothetical protein
MVLVGVMLGVIDGVGVGVLVFVGVGVGLIKMVSITSQF